MQAWEFPLPATASGTGEKKNITKLREGKKPQREQVGMHSAAFHEQKKGRRIEQGCCVLTLISLTFPKGSDVCSICNSAQVSKIV